MTVRTKSTLRMLCVRSNIANLEISEEAQKLLQLYEDPDVAPEQKAIAKIEIERMIRELEDKVATTRRVRGDSALGNG